MATQLRKELAYDASVKEVAAMLADPAFREKVLSALSVVRGSAEVDGSRVRVEQVWSANTVPTFARTFVGDEIVVVQDENWSTPTNADVKVSIPGKPADMSGTAVLEPTPTGGTTETVTLAIKVGLPLVGGKIEKLIADMLDKALDKEHQTGVAWLAGS